MPNSTEFNIGFIATEYLQDPSNIKWADILTHKTISSNITDSLIKKAEPIKEYLNTVNKEMIDQMGYEFTLDGYKCIMYNGRGNSTTFGELIDKYDICAMFYFNGERYFYSLYSKTVDTSVISKRMCGGGHPGASGFSNRKLLFTKGSNFNSEGDGNDSF